MIRYYTAEQIEDMESVNELYVCHHCDHHGHSDDFGDKCPVCHENLEFDDET